MLENCHGNVPLDFETLLIRMSVELFEDVVLLLQGLELLFKISEFLIVL